MPTIVVEDGNGIVGANAYVDVAYVDTYVTNFGDPLVWDIAASEKRKAVIHATRFIDMKYCKRFLSTILTNDQGLLWPRQAFTDNVGRTYESGIIPKSIKEATAELAIKFVTDGSLELQPLTNNNLKRRSVNVGQGAVQETIEYFAEGNDNPYIKSDILLCDILKPTSATTFRQAVRG